MVVGYRKAIGTDQKARAHGGTATGPAVFKTGRQLFPELRKLVPELRKLVKEFFKLLLAGSRLALRTGDVGIFDFNADDRWHYAVYQISKALGGINGGLNLRTHFIGRRHDHGRGQRCGAEKPGGKQAKQGLPTEIK